LEIHTALFPERQPFVFDAKDLWERAKPLCPPLGDTHVPDPMHSLLHACLHFFWSHQGRFGAWRTIRDLDAIMRTGVVDWDEFIAVARVARATTSCYWTFRIAQLTAGVSVPNFVLETLRPPRHAYVLRAVERHFMMNLFPVQFACPSVALDHALWELGVMPSWSGHGAFRPWDEELEFVVPGAAPPKRVVMPDRGRMQRFLSSPAYLAALFRSRR
jgi:hypothetical protein